MACNVRTMAMLQQRTHVDGVVTPLAVRTYTTASRDLGVSS